MSGLFESGFSYQQWQPLASAPLKKRIAINTGGYIFRGSIYDKTPSGIFVQDGYGNIYPPARCESWSWSDKEPEAEMLMVKPHGIFLCHWWNEVGHLLRLIDHLEIKFFVEIGLLDGGLTALMLSRAEYTGMSYLGIDPNARSYVDKRVWSRIEANKPKAGILCEDALCNGAISTVWANLHQNAEVTTPMGRAFIYCDGADKAKEAHAYWPNLLSGDILGLHDYSDDPNAVGPEVFPQDVASLLEQGRRIGKEELAETRLLILEKP